MKKSLSLKERECIIEATSLELAPHFHRIVAFLLDTILVTVASAFLLSVFILPEYFPGAQDRLQEQVQEYLKLLQAARDQGNLMVEMSFDRIVQEAIGACVFWFLGLFSLYNAIGEAFFRGSSIGKRMFALQVVSVITLEPLGFVEAFLRSSLKAFSLMVYAPLLWINYFLAFFGTKRQCGHDFLMRTVVIIEFEPPEGEAEDDTDAFDDDD